MKQILIVEDDVYINNLLEEILKDKYKIIKAYSGSEALLILEQKQVDLVILDLMLPGVNGEEVLKKIKGTCKIIVLSAKSSINDKVNNLLNGAHDYLTKPFNSDELLARVAVQLRQSDKIPTKIIYKELAIDTDNFIVTVNKAEVKLTKLEYGILLFLIMNPNRVFSRGQIFEHVWNYDSLGNEESVKVHISNLRSKLAECSNRKFIDTVWGIGFKFIME